MQVLRNQPLFHRQNGLDDAGHSGRRLQMADIGLDRADQQRAVLVSSATVGRRCRVELDRVADLRTGPVRLHIVDFERLDAGALERCFDHPLLGRTIRDGQPWTRPVLVDGRSADHAPDAVAFGLRLIQPLKDENAAAFAPDVTVGGGVEGLALSVRRKHPGVGAHLQQPAGEDRVHPAHQREVRFPPLQAGYGLVHRHQG